MSPQNPHAQTDRYLDPHLIIDFDCETAQLDGKPVQLTHKAFCLLAFLARHPGQLITRETLLNMVWGYGAGIRTRTLDVHIRRLRKGLGHYGNTYVETIFGVGYRFQPYRAHVPVEAAAVSAAMQAPDTGNWRWKMAGDSVI